MLHEMNNFPFPFPFRLEMWRVHKLHCETCNTIKC
uniref:Uncharacterized protein n=1 Tax=Rhizophora mucronata TaxID=61149 RepID=A0A2P2NI97_RHIMU